MSEIKTVYLDNNATTPVDDEVLEAMLPFLKEQFFNPSSLYAPSKSVKKRIQSARQSVATLLNCSPDEVIFTSGGSESNVMAIMGHLKNQPEKKHIITSAVEHASIMETMKTLEAEGYTVTYLIPDSLGRISPEDLKKAMRKDTALVTIMLANNELGNIYPVKELAEIAKAGGAAFHTDGVQAVGKIKVDLEALGVDSLSLSGHKLYAPKGVGALYIRGGKIPPIIHGHQEKNMRGGTENVASIVALGVAADEITKSRFKFIKTIASLRDGMEKKICSLIPETKIYGDKGERICNTSCMAFRGVDAHKLMFMLEGSGIFVSTGSACNSESAEPSHVLLAIKADMENYPAIRVSLSKHTTKDDIAYFIANLKNAVERLRRKR